jgi:hypothetical protein
MASRSRGVHLEESTLVKKNNEQVPVTRVLLSQAPCKKDDGARSWLMRGVWPCSWICCESDAPLPWVAVYRLSFSLDRSRMVRLHVAADECYEFFVDGKFAARGSERGDPKCWFFDTWDVSLDSGPHVFVARVWSLGRFAPRAQMSIRPGFLLSPDDEGLAGQLGTGLAQWEGKLLRGYDFKPPFEHPFFSIGYNTLITGNEADNTWRAGGGGGWSPVRVMNAGSDAVERTRVGGEHLLVPAMLPDQVNTLLHRGKVRHAMIKDNSGGGIADDTPYLATSCDGPAAEAWDGLWKHGRPLTAPPRTTMRVLIDFEDYICARPSLVTFAGDGVGIRLFWAESLFCEPKGRPGRAGGLEAVENDKGNRNEIEGKFFHGVGDLFFPNNASGFVFDVPFWRAGRYLEITVTTGAGTLEIRRFELAETRYPLQIDSTFECDDPRVSGLFRRAVRTLSASCHDAYVDPYYEQMMWAGDGLQNGLVNFVLSRDARLAKKWLKVLHSSRMPDGWVCARYPAKDNLLIAPFALYWVMGLKEYAWWHGDIGFVRELLPAARNVLQVFEQFIQPGTRLLLSPPGWNFVDWVPGWEAGVPPGADRGTSGSILYWHWIVALMRMAELEESLGEHEMTARHHRKAREGADAVIANFWDEKQGLFSDDLAGESFSEHAQSFAIVSGLLPEKMELRIAGALMERGQLHRATVSFSHHLFEAYCRLGLADKLYGRLGLWFDLKDLGLLTLPEGPEPSRSDCHSWSTHPVYHFYASLLGIRPASPGFLTVRIKPQFGPLKRMSARMAHPDGVIGADLTNDEETGRLRGAITLPAGVGGNIYYKNQVMALSGGFNPIDLML